MAFLKGTPTGTLAPCVFAPWGVAVSGPPLADLRGGSVSPCACRSLMADDVESFVHVLPCVRVRWYFSPLSGRVSVCPILSIRKAPPSSAAPEPHWLCPQSRSREGCSLHRSPASLQFHLPGFQLFAVKQGPQILTGKLQKCAVPEF